MSGTPQLVAKLLYGSGLRMLEALRLRVKDLDFEMKQPTVRDGKGAKDRFTVLAEGVRHSFATHALQRGADIRTGHEDVSTTMRNRPQRPGGVVAFFRRFAECTR